MVSSPFVRCLESFGDAVGVQGQVKNYVYKHDMRDGKFFCRDPFVKFSGTLPSYLHPEFELAYPVKQFHVAVEDVTDEEHPVTHYDATFFLRDGESGKTVPGDLKPAAGQQIEFLPFCAAPGSPRRIRLTTQAAPVQYDDLGIREYQEYNLSFSADESHQCAKPPTPTPPEAFSESAGAGASGAMPGTSGASGVVMNPVTGGSNVEVNGERAKTQLPSAEAYAKFLEQHGYSESTNADDKQKQLEMMMESDPARITEFGREPTSWTQYHAKPTVM
mmetsp:Transcript_22289/g.56333  ORF Transcript_22289/g.56333 Transcript_22289/m.56333 type:complete len:275 (-) Transcript_22289:238-1062(-)|eukprot:CAMPEP_0178994422 /NCGR_PEP_ID=MMETSP0795-20121207/7261_1 /TAXON_ID=88552 /ORGANISM="Amoebophrya sp., Strain Ameob2" /LENGTH=274 /DNA_ID=CAMNT_0020686613 /DNA_START=30 /DNA_END=854 /DNA_ORIENTATION=-